MERLPFWSDGFDLDLLKVLPEVESWCEKAAAPLYVHGHQTHGRLNSPTAWNHDHGLICFFSFDPSVPSKPAGYVTDGPIVECTLLEALRDLWVHGLYATLEGYPFWNSEEIHPSFDALMYHFRGWQLIPTAEKEAHQAHVRLSIQLAIQRYGQLLPRTRRCTYCSTDVPEGRGETGPNGECICCVHCVENPLGCRCFVGEFGVEESEKYFVNTSQRERDK